MNRHDLSRELLRTWVRKHEDGELTGGDSPRPDLRAYEVAKGDR